NLQPEWSQHVTIVYQTKDLHTADYTQLYNFLKYNQKEVDELKAKRLAKNQDPLALMENSNNPYAFPASHQDQSSFNQNYLQQPMPNPEDITYPTTPKRLQINNMLLVVHLKPDRMMMNSGCRLEFLHINFQNICGDQKCLEEWSQTQDIIHKLKSRFLRFDVR
nr:hypothetical protein [Tanacetum cinerariifolium]